MPRPRGRPRTVRPRLSRMDAAVDAMLPLGFPEKRVKKHVKQLLKVYGGDEGWPFIEEFSYKVLLESILEERDDEEQVAQNGFLLEPVENRETIQLSDKPHGDEEPVCCRASDTKKDMVPSDIIEAPSDKPCGDEEPDCNRASDTQKDMVPLDIIEAPSAAVTETTPLPASSPPRDSTPLLLPVNRRTRVPCYGWIEIDEDDADEFICLTPASTAIGERATLNVTAWRKKRRSRWDVKPGDP